MILALLAQKAVDPSPWPPAIGGLIAMAVGLLLIIRPRKSREIIHKINQPLRPWEVGPTPLPVIVVGGCFLLLMGASFLYVAWVFLSR